MAKKKTNKITLPFVFYRSRCMKIGTHSRATALLQRAQMTRTVQLHRHDVYGQLHCPISAQIGPVDNQSTNQTRGGGGALPSNRLTGTCPWMGPHFHDWIDFDNRVAFSIELLEWGSIFSGFGGKNILASREFGY